MPLSKKASLASIKSLFTKKKDDCGEQTDTGPGFNYEEGHPASTLRRASSRWSLRSQTKENTRRNSQSSNTSNGFSLRSQGSRHSMRAFGFEWHLGVTRVGVANPPTESPRRRERAHTVGVDSEGHVRPPPRNHFQGEVAVDSNYVYDLDPYYLARPRRGHALASNPRASGFYPHGGQERNDSMPHEDAIERAESPGAGSYCGSDSSGDTIRGQLPSPNPLSQNYRPATPPRRCRRQDCRCCGVDRGPSRELSNTGSSVAGRNTRPGHVASNAGSAAGDRNLSHETSHHESLYPAPLAPRPHQLRRVRAVTFREREPEPTSPEPIPQPDVGTREFMWAVGAGLCRRVEREETERAGTPACDWRGRR